MYAVWITRLYTTNDAWHGSSHTPTFYLDKRTQMIRNPEHAEEIIRVMLVALGVDPAVCVIHITEV